jgi:hypothetical protein
MYLNFSNQYSSGLYLAVGYYSPGCEGSNWASNGWFRLEPGQSGICLETTNEYSTFYAEGDDGAVWNGPYGVELPYYAFNDWCWDLGISEGVDVGMRLVTASSAWFPWVGTINLT